MGHPNPTADGRLTAAVLAAGPGALVSHQHAATLWGLTNAMSGPVHVTTPHRSRQAIAGVRLHRTRRIHTDDVAVVRGIPVTSVARMLVDLTDELSSQGLGRLLREAAFQRLLNLELVDAALARAHGRRHLARLTAALQAHRPGKVLRSELERRFLALCREAGLPEPETNLAVVAAGKTYEVDCLWRAERVVVELDGAAAHHTAHAFEADRERDAALIAADLRPLRFTWRRVTRQAAAVAAEVGATLRTRRR